MHVHSRFSDGANSLEENFQAARAAGLRSLGCVEHVRRSTTWIPQYVAAVDALRGRGLRITAGVEAKLLDTDGTLDMPDDIEGVDLVYVADHRFPAPDGTRSPAQIRSLLAEGRASAGQLIDMLLTATERAMERYPNVVLAHLFSVLPKVGLDERVVSIERLRRLAAVARATGALVEIDERWRCPNARTLRPFLDAGVPVVASTDSHCAATIGQYAYASSVIAALEAA